MPPVCSEDDGSDSAPLDPCKAPPDPPETLNIFENQRYLSKLIQWGFEASEREQGRPHLVETDQAEIKAALATPASRASLTHRCGLLRPAANRIPEHHVLGRMLLLVSNLGWACEWFFLERKRVLDAKKQVSQIRQTHAAMLEQLDEILRQLKTGLVGQRSQGGSPLPWNLSQSGRPSQ